MVIAAALVGGYASRGERPARGLFTVDGVALGMSADQVRAIRGEPQRRTGDSWEYDWGSKVNIVQVTSEPTIDKQDRYVIGVLGAVLALDGREVTRAHRNLPTLLEVLGKPDGTREPDGSDRVLYWSPAGVSRPIPGPHASRHGHVIARVREGRILSFGLFLGDPGPTR